MSRARKEPISPLSNVIMHSARVKLTVPKISFVLKLEEDIHTLLRGISDVEDRSMQWLLNKMASEAIKRKAKELGIVN
jgi:hypothetical protein